MIVSIHQPSYFPWLGLLDKINNSDLYVLLDNVQLTDSAYQNRNIFLDNQGNKKLLTIPISKKDYINNTIKDIKFSNGIWQKKHNKFIYFNYKKHPFFDEIYPFIEPLYKKNYNYLIDFLIENMQISLELFKIDTKLMIASELDYNKELKKEDMVLDILNSVDAKIYLSGKGAMSYQNEDNFNKKGIKLIYQEFTHPVYKQKGADSFVDGLACLDALFNLGTDESSKMLKRVKI